MRYCPQHIMVLTPWLHYKKLFNKQTSPFLTPFSTHNTVCLLVFEGQHIPGLQILLVPIYAITCKVPRLEYHPYHRNLHLNCCTTGTPSSVLRDAFTLRLMGHLSCILELPLMALPCDFRLALFLVMLTRSLSILLIMLKNQIFFVCIFLCSQLH